MSCVFISVNEALTTNLLPMGSLTRRLVEPAEAARIVADRESYPDVLVAFGSDNLEGGEKTFEVLAQFYGIELPQTNIDSPLDVPRAFSSGDILLDLCLGMDSESVRELKDFASDGKPMSDIGDEEPHIEGHLQDGRPVRMRVVLHLSVTEFAPA